MSTLRLPQPVQRAAPSSQARSSGTVAGGVFGGIGLDLVPAIPAPYDEPNAGGSSAVERHRRTGFARAAFEAGEVIVSGAHHDPIRARFAARGCSRSCDPGVTRTPDRSRLRIITY
jgi:hypothetical protein